MTGAIRCYDLYVGNITRPYLIEEVVDYKLWRGSYRHILIHGGEEVFELTHKLKMVKIWHKTNELPESGIFGEDTIIFRSEKLRLKEIVRPRVTVNGEDKGQITYAIYVGESGTVVRIEQWPGKIKTYELSKEEIPISSMRAKRDSS